MTGTALLLAGCGGPAELACPATAARAGISLDVAAPLAAKVAKASVDGTELPLFESTRATSTTCTSGKPEDSCQAAVVGTGAKNGFLDKPGLATSPITVTVRLTDAEGVVLVDQAIELTPKQVFPAGPRCGGAQPQAGVWVGPDGTLAARS